MIALDLLMLFVALAAGFCGGIGFRALQARERSSFRPQLPRPSHTPQLPAPHLPVANPYRGATHVFVPQVPQAQHEPGAPCFVCGLPLDEADHSDC